MRSAAESPTRSVKHLFVASYVFANLYAYVSLAASGEFGGELAGFPVPSASAGALLVAGVVLSYVVVLFPAFNFLRRRLRAIRLENYDVSYGNGLHLAVLVLQLFLLGYALYIGNVAGRIVHTSSPLRLILYFLPIDYLALVYLTLSRDSKFFRVNGFVYLVTTVLRGLSSGFLFLLMVLLLRLQPKTRLAGRTLLFLCILPLALPLVYVLRFYFRYLRIGATEVATGEPTQWSDVLLYFGVEGSSASFLGLVGYSVGAFLDRLQQFSFVAMELTNRDEILSSIQAGSTRLFLFDGPFFTAVYRLLGLDVPLELNSSLRAILFPWFDPYVVGYDVHTGFIGWIVIMPAIVPLYLLYVTILGVASILLSRSLGNSRVIGLTWFMWFLLLMNGWFGAFILYLVSLIVFILLERFVSSRAKNRVNYSAGFRRTPKTFALEPPNSS